jgi:hypothetical protein
VTDPATFDLKTPGADEAAAAAPETAVVARVDFAQVENKQFFAYGWILGFATAVRSASISLGNVEIDLLRQATRVRRLDIMQHFSLSSGDDEHGFYALIDLPGDFASVNHLKLSVVLFSGEKGESLWPVVSNNAFALAAEPHLTMVKELLRGLTRPHAKRLIKFASPALGAQGEPEFVPALPPPVQVAIDLCCVLDDRILVVAGWAFDPVKELTLAQVHVGGAVFDFLQNSVPIRRSDVTFDSLLYRKADTPKLPGFAFAQVLPLHDIGAEEARFVMSTGTETVHQIKLLNGIPHKVRQEFLTFLSKLDADAVLAMSERVATLLDTSAEQRSLHGLLELACRAAVERLPISIERTSPRCCLYIDQVISVADKGIFLVGWFNGESREVPRILCHCGPSSFLISDSWIRHVRTDVTSHLAAAGINATDNDHGFTCYVPLTNDDAPYYLSMTLPSGEVERMRLKVDDKAETALQTVRALLSSFKCEHPDLCALMDRQIGPAVGVAWAARHKPVRQPVVRSYGVRPMNPLLSILVTLYGRHDFADYQMALFADDPDFQRVELIYVVDDPTIFAAFSGACPDLYRTYLVPFVLASSGTNLGFAGANNFGAEIARGQHLLFVNSDVLPKRPLWVSDLLRVYRSLQSPGMLGAKLLYEDGSVQHAGMAFRRYSAWSDMWINDHPLKGQSPLGLSGVSEVDAVTAACAVMEAALYRKLGGFSEDYIVGDFEDSDLCLRASSAGRRNYVALDVEMYHLERQSQTRIGDSILRTNLTLYNCWLQNSRWAEQIEKAHRESSASRKRT